MEPDPIVLAWRAARGRHLAAVALALGLGGPLCILALLCLRDLVHTLGHDEATALVFLRVAIARTADDLVLVPGWSLAPLDLERAAFFGLSACALALAGLGWFVAALSFSAQSRAVLRMREAATAAILDAPPGAREEARGLAGLLGQALGRVDGLLAIGILVPAMALGAILVALGFAALAAPRLVPAAAVGLFAAAMARELILRRSASRSALRLRSSALAERTLGDLVRRMPAVRIHGSATLERARIAEKAAATRAALSSAEAKLAYARAPSLALAIILPAMAAGAALWRGGGNGAPPARDVDPAALVAAAGAFAVAAILIALTLNLSRLREGLRPLFRETARTIAALEGRRGRKGGLAVPRAGDLAARGVGAYDAATGERLSGVDLTLAMPSHVAITGIRGSGARVLAAILAGQVAPTAGNVTYAGHDLSAFDAADRARRIAFAAGEAILVEGTLRANILYGADPAAAPDQPAFVEILRITGLDAFAYSRGLLARVDPVAAPDFASALVAARATMRTMLKAEGAERLVEPFDPARYNHQATVGENILFGEPVGQTFAPKRLARHPYMRAVLEAEDLVRPLTEIGLAVARSTVEIFADLPNDHPLFDAFSLFPADERGYFEDLVVRQPNAVALRRGPAGQRDRERLIGLALRYSETRHRFGLIDAAFEERLVAARRSFARMLPAHLAAAVEFHDPTRINPAASVEENLLFGRVSLGEAGAEPRVRAIVRRVLTEEGLEASVYRLGLDSRVEPGSAGTGSVLGEGAIPVETRIAIDLARCLIRQPDIVVVAILLDERKPAEIAARITRLRAARAGRGLIVCVPDAADLDVLDPFDAVIAVENSTVVPVPAKPARALEPA
ncbi:ABC transporter ATP-binding protein [Methylobacterium sp. E-016]|uniref:ATP-binding cassette domain-containing protein n=1 Tax=Methylobacterium sp. E-016 TaxID=2836556 RepID=UPI001FB9CFE7|nr:ATP-binding cassette domain-containing protein [Methylobacterium sp. E-016]MCJ2075702.1 ABC transporter ATP-binding protein [Methylobacterium sp. E-016]